MGPRGGGGAACMGPTVRPWVLKGVGGGCVHGSYSTCMGPTGVVIPHPPPNHTQLYHLPVHHLPAAQQCMGKCALQECRVGVLYMECIVGVPYMECRVGVLYIECF